MCRTCWRFSSAHWKPGHIFTRDRELFDWQYTRQDRPGEYPIALARKNGDGELAGMLGYLPTRRFNPALADNNAIWLALWKVREDIAGGPIGLQLLNDVTARRAACQHRCHRIPARSRRHLHGAQVSGRRAAPLRAAQSRCFRIRARVVRTPPDSTVPDTNLTAVAVDDTTFSATAAGLFRSRMRGIGSCRSKHRRIFVRGIFSIPGIDMKRSCCAATVGRSACWPRVSLRIANGGRSRVVDFVGADDLVPALGRLILVQVRRHGAEYADILNWGIDPVLFEAAGFSADQSIRTRHRPEPFRAVRTPQRARSLCAQGRSPGGPVQGRRRQDRPNQPSVS